MTDQYQERYLAHQERKAEVLRQIMLDCHSDRVFDPRPIDQGVLERVCEAGLSAPSSCDRRAVQLQLIEDRDRKALLGGLLVGGVGWVHRAAAVLLVQADPAAYKAPGELAFMPFLDCAFVADRLLLAAEAEGLRHCFINPSIREPDREHFDHRFGKAVFGGAVALGWPLEPEWVQDTP